MNDRALTERRNWENKKRFKYGSKREMGLRKGFGYQQKSGLPDRKVYGNTQSENGCGTIERF